MGQDQRKARESFTSYAIAKTIGAVVALVTTVVALYAVGCVMKAWYQQERDVLKHKENAQREGRGKKAQPPSSSIGSASSR